MNKTDKDALIQTVRKALLSDRIDFQAVAALDSLAAELGQKDVRIDRQIYEIRPRFIELHYANAKRAAAEAKLIKVLAALREIEEASYRGSAESARLSVREIARRCIAEVEGAMQNDVLEDN